MNLPLSQEVLRALQSVSLDDKYALESGLVFMSGIQALVKLPMMQRSLDALHGRNTAGFISGYRGSPLGGYDQALWNAKQHLQKQNIVFQPGVNEELAATAIWGTQQLGFAPPGTQRFDGVFGIWYGKGPGVDRCADVFKHANMAGTAPLGGALVIAGDDHVAKSSTAVHQSDHIFKACGLPVFFPSTVQEILEYGLHAIAMSRFAGVWTSMKTIQEVVESSARVNLDINSINIVIPEFAMPPGGLHIRWPDHALDQEARLFHYKWYAALAYVRANQLNHTLIKGPQDRLGLIASGKAFNDMRQALFDLGLTEAECHRLGVRVHKVGVVWPLEAQLTREFATGLREILVVEEKRQMIEYQLKEELYNWRPEVRPDVLGKFNEMPGDHSGGEWSLPNPVPNMLLRANADLNPALIGKAIAQRLLQLGVDEGTQARLNQYLERLKHQESNIQHIQTKAERLPWFCSGCPHNTSTRVPEGSRALGGIGCHFMVLWMDRQTLGFTQMGGEGVPWVGQQPFSKEKHVFANLGDGTYFHSGILAIRQSIVAGVNITYKLLYNDAVAMTGGQALGERPDGLSVAQITNTLLSEGVQRLVVVTDEPQRYHKGYLPDEVAIYHRDQLDWVQRQFREIKGTTVIIYDQTCATEKRRRRKRGLMTDSAQKVFINPLVCEGCGDCSTQSNCLSVEPLETSLGRKRTINQSTCNKDFSCVKGFCPSFVTVVGEEIKKVPAVQDLMPFPKITLPSPQEHALHSPWGILIAGVGGTGVITLGQILGVAAHIEDKWIVTQDAAGLAQKGGATWSHVMIAKRQEDILTTRINPGGADLILGSDAIVAASKESMIFASADRTKVILNEHSPPTAEFILKEGWINPANSCAESIRQLLGADATMHFDAHAVAVKCLGDSIYVNPIMLGYAWQKGLIPLSLETILRAFELNGVAVKQNQRAFEWGRHCAHDWQGVKTILSPSPTDDPTPTLEKIIAERFEFLKGYQNISYAKQYEQLVQQVRTLEQQVMPAKTQLTEMVAKNLFKLMAYKDEYEVARLHLDSAFNAQLKQQFKGSFSIRYHLAPPVFAAKNERGELIKSTYGSWMMLVFKVLARLKGLRGTAFDPFAYSQERIQERAWIAQYQSFIKDSLKSLNQDNYQQLLNLAKIPENIKGYGHIKARRVTQAQNMWNQQMIELNKG